MQSDELIMDQEVLSGFEFIRHICNVSIFLGAIVREKVKSYICCFDSRLRLTEHDMVQLASSFSWLIY